MAIKLLKTEVSNLDMYENEKFIFDFTTAKRVSQEEKESNVVSNLFNNMYSLNAISLVGINASGKTMSLNILSDIMRIYIENKSLTDTTHLSYLFDNEIIIKNILFDEVNLYEITSYIGKDTSGNLFFSEEVLKETKITSAINQKNLNSIFNNTEANYRSKISAKFLKDEDSIFSAILLDNPKKFIIDLSSFTNFNIPALSQFVEIPYIQYLDPSIEKFEMINQKNSKDQRYLLKFKSSSKKYELNESGLRRYLSSGTIKGINILVGAKEVLRHGSYLFIDEIENHLNKTIVLNLINLFTSEANPYGATFIFTTHYAEILDSMTRTDGIYITEKNEKISVIKYSDKAGNNDRIDKKKSDLILSGSITSTPSYQTYIKLKRNMKEFLT